MEQALWFIDAVERMKEELFSPSAGLFSLLPVSAYETAWVAMVPDTNDPTRPMFPECLDWVLRSQNDRGFWVDHVHEHHGLDLDELDKHQWNSGDLMATLACLLVLNTWVAGSPKIIKGLKFLRDNMEKEVMEMRKSKEGGDEGHALLRWFLMVELAKAKGLQVNGFHDINDDQCLLIYTNSSNSSKGRNEKEDEKIHQIMRQIPSENSDLVLFRSPSATARAFMMTGDKAYKAYLQDLLANCQHGVPPIYLVDKDVIKLCVVDHLERLGCAELFTEEIRNVMDYLYRKWIAEESKAPRKDDAAFQIYQDSLAFRLLRRHGYQVSPRRFCWFIDDEEMLSYMKDNYTFFLGPMLSIYKASSIAFPDDHQLDKAGVFSQQILQMRSQNGSISAASTEFEQEIEHELGLKWLARMDHLEHRLYIERGGIYHFWNGKNAPCRILQNDELLQLAIANFMTRQSVYRNELNELQRWSKDTGLSMMGFGRENTAYCYFAMASSTCLPLDTDSRKETAKCAILITVADDFFDEKGSLHELSILTDAVQRWEGEGLTSHSKVIFTALNNLVHDISLKSFKRHGHDVKKILQDTWKEIFKSWLKEAEWSRSSHHPSIDQYIEIAKTSIAVEMIVLPACYLTNSKISHEESCWDFSNATIMKSLAVSCRLLNELESCEKEAKAGKPNIVLLYLKENPKAKIDDVIALVRNILERKKKEVLQLVMSRDSGSDMPREWKEMHLSCLKAFQMFFNSTNAFDSPTALLKSINKAIYEPVVKEITSQPADFISKELKTTKTKAPDQKVKIGRVSNKRALLSFDSNKWLDPRTDKKFHRLSFASSFMALNSTTYKSVLWK